MDNTTFLTIAMYAGLDLAIMNPSSEEMCIRDSLLGVLHMALDAQAQGLGALQQQECIERGDGGTGIAQQDGAEDVYKRQA